MKTGVSALLLVILVAIVTGCAGSAISPSASVTTAVQGWERYFRLEWQPQARPDGALIDGYIYNTYGSPAGNVRILAQAFDNANNVVAQRIEWVPGVVPPLSRSYFRVAALPPAHRYQVSVWSWDTIEAPDGHRF